MTYGANPENAKVSDVYYVLQRGFYNMKVSKKFSNQKMTDVEEAILRTLSPTFDWDNYDSSILTVNA